MHLTYGICKVIPPDGWFVREDAYDLYGEVGKIIITNPNCQFISGKKGAHTININDQKDMSVLGFSNYCAQYSYESELHSSDSYVEREKHLWRAVGQKSGHDDTNAPLAIYGIYSFEFYALMIPFCMYRCGKYGCFHIHICMICMFVSSLSLQWCGATTAT